MKYLCFNAGRILFFALIQIIFTNAVAGQTKNIERLKLNVEGATGRYRKT